MICLVKVGKWIAKNRILILFLAILTLIPSTISMMKMRTNYDVLTYLPETLETVKGQDIIVDEYGMGGFAMVVVENKAMKDTAALEKEIEAIPHVKDVLWYDDVADITLPVNMLPQDLKDKFYKGDATMMLALLDDSTSSDNALQAVADIRKICDEDCYVSGTTAIIEDLKELADREVPIYVTIAVILCLIALEIFSTSWITPFLFLLSIGFAILWNMGTNQIFGEISYITKAVAAVLQLGVTTDYSIFLLGSYEENKKRFPGEKNRAMGHAISNTFKSIIGSSVTTIAGFIALCFMSFTLGRDLGLVMAKGVLFGVLSCITVLPALVLFFDKLIDKTTHKPLIRNVTKLSDFITKHYKVWLVLFLVALVPAVYGNNHVPVYYDMSASMPDSLPSKIATKKVQDDFGTSTIQMVLFDKNIPAKDKKAMLDDINDTDGVTYCIGLNSLIDPTLPDSMIPDDVKDMLQSDNYEMAFISTEYYIGSDELNNQVTELNKIVKSYDSSAMVIGEGPLTKDLMDVTDVDFRNVNTASIGIIFAIILLVFKSVSLPVILELVIEFAIMVNMSVSYYMGSTLVFITSIILGTVQLGSTVDYAILMTNRYQKERRRGNDKATSVRNAHRATMLSIITSGVAFFSATFGVALYTQIDVIKSVCLLLARGALISTLVVIFILPAMFMIFDKLIVHTTWDFFGKRESKAKKAARKIHEKKEQRKAAMQSQ